MGKNKHLRKKQFSDVNKETDARFWAQTGYKPGAPLNMKDPSDLAMSKVWSDVHAHVIAEAGAGNMVRTFEDPKVVDHLDNAKKAHLAAVNHMIGAQSATDTAHLDAHLHAAKDANVIARESAAAAAVHQPPSITKAVLEAALAEVSATAPVEPGEVPAISGSDEGPVTAPTEAPQNATPVSQPDGPVMPGDPEWVDYAGEPTTSAPKPQPQTAPAPAPAMLAPENDPWDGRYKPPMQADNPPPSTSPTQPAPTPTAPAQTGHPMGPPPGWKAPPEWVDYTGQKPTHDPGAPTSPAKKPSGSPRGRAKERAQQQQRAPRQPPTVSNGPSAGQVALGVGAVGLFFGVVAFFRGRA